MPRKRAMNVELPPDQQAFLLGMVAAGRYRSIGDAIREGVDLLISRQDLQQQIQLGIDQADRGDVIDHATVFRHLRTLASKAVKSAQRQ